MEQANQDPGSYFHMETLVLIAQDLFFGGTETTAITLQYGFLLLLRYPEIQAPSTGRAHCDHGSQKGKLRQLGQESPRRPVEELGSKNGSLFNSTPVLFAQGNAALHAKTIWLACRR
nr:cytochrome P450 2F2-like [Pelodiscus sinensis]|eukprot:XP_014431783.1 cytochrome P450 2F2-like [Pelodiscus sinensis]